MNTHSGFDGPIYLRLAREIELGIATGQYAPGSRLPGVREMAEYAGVNPNTMQRALAELERFGYVYAQGTSGRYITGDELRILQMREALAKNNLHDFLTGMQQLGFTPNDALLQLKEFIKEIQQ